MTNPKRKGARSKKEIPSDILEQLNRGEIECANLVEWLAVDRKALLKNVLTQHGRQRYERPVLERVGNLKKQTVNTVTEAIGSELLNQCKLHSDEEFLQLISNQQSDLVRSWVTFTIGRDTSLSIGEMLDKIRTFAADHHFNVREEAWSAVRPTIAENLKESLEILRRWVVDDDENIRRFASEATRPRGVWCQHIEALKRDPQLALPLLEPLKADKSRYVRDSVGNWLNDASKTQPEFIVALCRRWEKESPVDETKYITKKALRTVCKSKEQKKT